MVTNHRVPTLLPIFLSNRTDSRNSYWKTPRPRRHHHLRGSDAYHPFLVGIGRDPRDQCSSMAGSPHTHAVPALRIRWVNACQSTTWVG